jgi:hypothetical protein
MSELHTQPPLFGVAQTQSTTDDYYTPAWVFERMGIGFDLDVCSPPTGLPWIPARRFLTKEDDGLASEWTGRVWMNPPYSQATPWVARFMQHHNGVCLMPWAKSAWTIKLWADAEAVVVPDQWFNFTGGPSGGSISTPVFFAAYTEECVEAIGHLGVTRRAA